MVENKASIANTEKEERKKAETQSKQRFSTVKPNKIAGWVTGIFVSLLPLILSLISLLNADVSQKQVYKGFISSFAFQGDLLWLSVTLLCISLATVLFNGIKQKSKRLKTRIFLLLMVLLVVVVMMIYKDNIGKDYSFKMAVMSVTGFILFSVFSFFITFKISREGIQ